MMRLDGLEVEAACYGLAGYVRHQTKCIGRPVHSEVVRLLRRLELERSVVGSENGSGSEQSEVELIGAEAAAQILGCSSRYVRLIARDLDGQRCGREWIFQRHKVQDYQARNQMLTQQKEPANA